MRRGELGERLDAHFYQPKFRQLIDDLKRRGAVPLSAAISRANETWDRSDGRFVHEFPYIEISAVGIDNNEYDVTSTLIAEAPSRAQQIVRENDLLVSLTRPHRGALACVRAEDDGAVCSTGFAVLRTLRSGGVDRSYLLFALGASFGLEQMLMRSSGGNYPAITEAELDRVLIPLLPLAKQHELVEAMEAAREARRAKLAKADAFLASMDAYLLETLGLAAPPDTPRKTFAVPASAVAGKRLDPPAYQPLVTQPAGGGIELRDLQDLADIDAHAVEKPGSEDALVPYVGLPECDLTEVREVATRPYREVKGRSVARPGNILFARIEPSVFNKKYVLAENLRGHDFAYTSTEFYVVTPRADQVVPEYLYAMFFCSFVFAQTKGKTTGSSGRRRLDPGMFRTLQIPVPDTATQQSIAAEIRRRRERARTLRAEAEQGWSEAKRWFEEQLLGPVN